MSDNINDGELKTGRVINARSEALVHDLSFEELDAVSGGNENARQAEAVKVFSQILREC